MDERKLVFETFKDRVGNVFTLAEENLPALSLTLTEAELLPARFVREGVRPPFSLIFREGGQLALPQALYRMKHDALGEVTLFLVPTGRDERGVEYQSLFN